MRTRSAPPSSWPTCVPTSLTVAVCFSISGAIMCSAPRTHSRQRVNCRWPSLESPVPGALAGTLGVDVRQALVPSHRPPAAPYGVRHRPRPTAPRRSPAPPCAIAPRDRVSTAVYSSSGCTSSGLSLRDEFAWSPATACTAPRPRCAPSPAAAPSAYAVPATRRRFSNRQSLRPCPGSRWLCPLSSCASCRASSLGMGILAAAACAARRDGPGIRGAVTCLARTISTPVLMFSMTISNELRDMTSSFLKSLLIFCSAPRDSRFDVSSTCCAATVPTPSGCCCISHAASYQSRALSRGCSPMMVWSFLAARVLMSYVWMPSSTTRCCRGTRRAMPGLVPIFR